MHERIQSLLNRIELSEYLLSPRTGKTVIDNALVHLDSNVVVKLDVKQFYPSTTDEHVFQFFRHRMRMADDVAGRLTKLCTVNNKVPMGSPLSPILCALVHDDMFGKATNLLAKQRMSTSLWVDDLTTSGESLSKSGLRSVRRLVNSKRMTTHKAAKSTANKGLVVTGIFVKNGELAPSNKSHVKMRDTLNALKVADNDVERLQVMRSLVGQINHFLQVYRDNSDMTERLRKRLAWLHSFRRRIEAGGVVTLSEMNASMPANDDALPWDEPV